MIIVDQLSTEELFEHLRDFGVDITETEFLEDVHEFRSSSELSDHWWETYPVTAVGHEEDFIWMAADVLWDRLAPDIVRAEQLHDLIQEGYDLREVEKHAQACDRWLEVWDKLKEGIDNEDLDDIREVDHFFPGFYSFHNWCQDLTSELQRAAENDLSSRKDLIEYSREFCDMFPKSDSLILRNVKIAEATSLFALGRVDEGEQAFEALIEEYPDFGRAYITWGDMYWRTRPNKVISFDYDTAEDIYRRALSRTVERNNTVEERLTELENERESEPF